MKKFRYILLVLLITRVFDVGVIYLAGNFIPYNPTFTYKHSLNSTLPIILNVLGNFDGVHYTHIAKENYAQYEQAFFPLYPLLIHMFYPLFKSYLIAGVFISNMFFIIALWIFYQLFGSIATLYLLIFPTSFFFNSVYTESLFLVLTASVLFALKKNKLLLISICSYLAGVTRLSGIFLAIPIFTHLISYPNARKEHDTHNIKDDLTFLCEQLKCGIAAHKSSAKLWIVLLPALGLITYSIYLFYTTGDPLFYFHAQPAFGANRSTNIILLPQVYYRYIKILITANRNYDYFIALVEFSIFNLFITVLAMDLLKIIHMTSIKEKFFRLGLNLFSFANIILPTLTGTFSSIPRYALLSLSLYVAFAEIKNSNLKIVIGTLFLFLHFILLAYFSQGYFVS